MDKLIRDEVSADIRLCGRINDSIESSPVQWCFFGIFVSRISDSIKNWSKRNDVIDRKNVIPAWTHLNGTRITKK